MSNNDREIANAENKAYLVSPEFCCGEIEIGNTSCEGCPFAPSCGTSAQF